MTDTFIKVLLIGIVSLAVAQKHPSPSTTMNIDTVLSNKFVVTNYIKCLLDTGKCTSDGRNLKGKC